MNYGEILKKVWQIVYKHPYLWFLGLLAGGSGGLQSSFQFGIGDTGQIRKFFEERGDGIGEKLVQVAGASTQEASLQQVLEFLTTNWAWITIGSVILFLFFIFLIILSISCQGGLVKAVAKEGQSNFFTSIREGFKYFWPVFLIRLLVPLGLIIVILFLFSPAIFGFLYSFPIIGFGWTFLGIIILIPLLLFTGIWMILSVREVVLANQGFVNSLRRGFSLIRKQIGQIFLVWIIDLGVRIIGGLAIALALFVGIIILGGISFLIGLLYLPAGIILGSLFLLALIVVLLAAGGFIKAFSSGFWTLSYQQLVKLKPNK